MKITKRQLRRIIREEIIREDENTNEAKEVVIDAAAKAAKLFVAGYFRVKNTSFGKDLVEKGEKTAISAIEALVETVKESGLVEKEKLPFLAITNEMLKQSLKNKESANGLIDFIVEIAKSSSIEMSKEEVQEMINKAAGFGIEITEKMQNKMGL